MCLYVGDSDREKKERISERVHLRQEGRMVFEHEHD